MPTLRVFAVSVLDDKKEVQAVGDLTVTNEHMSLQNHGAESSALWELRYLRRFGYDLNVFSFEAGRRCKDGPGIWAFSTPEAEELFKMVDHYINRVSKDVSKYDDKPADASEKDRVKLGGTVVKSEYAGVTIGGDGAKGAAGAIKSPYAQLDLSSKPKFKIPGSNGSPDKKAKTAYSELDFDKMNDVQEEAGNGNSKYATVVL